MRLRLLIKAEVMESVHRLADSIGLESLASHPLTGLGAPPALLCTVLHHLVAAGHALTILGTSPAHLGANAAGALMKVRPTKHEVGAGLTDFGAVQQ
jgi:hypothetical protein